jgi:hypothetical protein
MVLSGSEFINFAFWSGESNFSEQAASLIRGEQPYERIIRDGWWNRISTWLQDFDVEFERSSPPGKRIPIAEIHSPHVDGCVATFGTTQSSGLDVSIKAFGLGYQRIKRVDIQESYEVPGDCRALTTGAKFVIHVWKHRSSGKRRALIHMIDIDGSVVDEPLLHPHQHPCSNDYQSGAKRVHTTAQLRHQKMNTDYSDVPMRSSVPGAVKTQKMALEEGTVYSASFDLPINWFSRQGRESTEITQLSIGIEARVVKTIEMSWKLVAGHDYIRFRNVRDDMRMFWLWD